jgi:hypothetical protein
LRLLLVLLYLRCLLSSDLLLGWLSCNRPRSIGLLRALLCGDLDVVLSDVEVKGSTNGTVVGGGYLLSVYCDFRGRWHNLAFYLNRVAGYCRRAGGRAYNKHWLRGSVLPSPTFLVLLCFVPSSVPSQGRYESAEHEDNEERT